MIACDICPRACQIEEGRAGLCGVRANVSGENKDRLYRMASEPEPAGPTLTIKLVGCNLQCPFCVFPAMSTAGIRNPATINLRKVSEEELVELAATWGRPLVILSGGEPSIHYEYVLGVARLCKEAGILSSMHTNGYMNGWLAEKLARAVDTTFIGIKGSASPKTYAAMNADPSAVLDSVQVFWRHNKSTHLTNLVDPTFDTTSEDERTLAIWLRDKISPEVPFGIQSLLKTARGVEQREYLRGISVARRIVDAAVERFRASGLVNVKSLPSLACV